MANRTLRGHDGTRGGTGTGTGTPRQRSVAAAARAAAKRAERARERSSATSQRPRDPGDPKDDAPAGPSSTGPIDVAGSTDEVPLTKAGTDPVPAPTDDTDTTPARPSGRRSVLACAALAALLVAGLVATTLLGLEYRDAERTSEARTQAAAAARKAAPAILSYDYRHLDRDFAAARAHLTGAFRGKYTRTTSTVVAPTAKKYHGVVKATVATPPSGDTPVVSVVSASPGKAVILLFVNQVTESTRIAGPRVDLNRVRMAMTHTPNGWKVSAVDAL